MAILRAIEGEAFTFQEHDTYRCTNAEISVDILIVMQKYDLVIGSDVVYRDEDAPSLAAAITLRSSRAFILISVRYWKI